MQITSKIEHDIERRNFESVIEAVLKNPQLLDARGVWNETLLHKSCNAGCPELVRFFLSKGLDKDAADQVGFTPLHEAALGKSAEAVRMLLEAGANYRALTSKSHTPLQIAELHSTREIVDIFLAADVEFQRQLRAENERKQKEAEALLLVEAEKKRAQVQEQRRKDAEVEAQTAREAEERKRPIWYAPEGDSIIRITRKEQIDCELTEIFNFTDKTYILRNRNLTTKAEAVFMKDFGQFGDDSLIEQARAAFDQMGGKLSFDEGAIDKAQPDRAKHRSLS